MSNFEEFGDVASDLDNFRDGQLGQSIKPRFKTPFDVSDFVSSRVAKFEIDADAVEGFLHDDEEDEDGEIPEDGFNGSTRLQAGKHVRARATGPSFNAGQDLSFESFYDPDALKVMEDLLEDGGIKKQVVKEGPGIIVPDNCKVYVHYVCMAEGNDDPFDSTLTRGVPTCVDLRSSDLIVGLYIAIKSMRVQEVAKFWIRSDFAFGELGCPPRIPSSTDIFCIIEVLDIIEEEKLATIPFMSHDERANVPFEKIFEASKNLRTEGNGEYKNAAYWRAIKKYRKGVNILEEYPVLCSEDEMQRQDLLFTFYINLAQCYLKVNRPQQACIACNLGLRSKPVQDSICSKIFFRFAEAKLMLGSTADALRLCDQALVREPTNETIKDQKARILKRQMEDEKVTKSTYTKMGKAFLSSKTESNKDAKPKPSQNGYAKSEPKAEPSTSTMQKVPQDTKPKNVPVSVETTSKPSAPNQELKEENLKDKTYAELNLKSTEEKLQNSLKHNVETSLLTTSESDSMPLEWDEYQEQCLPKDTSNKVSGSSSSVSNSGTEKPAPFRDLKLNGDRVVIDGQTRAGVCVTKNKYTLCNVALPTAKYEKTKGNKHKKCKGGVDLEKNGEMEKQPNGFKSTFLDF